MQSCLCLRRHFREWSKDPHFNPSTRWRWVISFIMRPLCPKYLRQNAKWTADLVWIWHKEKVPFSPRNHTPVIKPIASHFSKLFQLLLLHGFTALEEPSRLTYFSPFFPIHCLYSPFKSNLPRTIFHIIQWPLLGFPLLLPPSGIPCSALFDSSSHQYKNLHYSSRVFRWQKWITGC